VIAKTEEELIKRLNEWKDNVEGKGMRVSRNKTKVMISGERPKVRQKAVRWPCGSAVKVSVAIHYSVLVGAFLQATSRVPRSWIGERPPDMAASCDIYK